MAVTSFRPGEVWPDTNGVPINVHGAGLVWHEGICYRFGGHKIAGEAGNRHPERSAGRLRGGATVFASRSKATPEAEPGLQAFDFAPRRDDEFVFREGRPPEGRFDAAL